MSRQIDERVVEMQFDNKQFEEGVATTMSTLDKLKAKLNLDGVGKSMEGLTKSANKVDLSALERSADAVQVKFSAMSMITMSVIDRLVNRVIDASERMVRSLTVEPISTGWSKYAQKTSAVQTIMAATASSFDDVNEQMSVVNDQLNKLTWFTDETSYHFNDMVSNIGKFTSNNVSLDKSVTAMQGIANWAAISGANANEASRAMYNLSQALGVGAVTAIDWKSIENANMATSDFKKQVLESAVSVGTLTKVSDDLYRTMDGTEVSVAKFRDTLQKKWFSSDVLMDTLDKYGTAVDKLYSLSNATGMTATELLEAVDAYGNGTLDLTAIAEETGVSVEKLDEAFKDLTSEESQFSIRTFRAAQEAKTFGEAVESAIEAVGSGWSRTFELIFGDYLEAKKLWTSLANTLYDIFAESGNTRNAILEVWNTLGGRKDILEALSYALSGLKKMAEAVSDAFHDMFPRMTAVQLKKLTWEIKEFAKSLEVSDEAANTLKVVIKALLLPVKVFVGIVEVGVVAVAALGLAVFKLAEYMLRLASTPKAVANGFRKIFGDARYERIANAMATAVGAIAAAFDFAFTSVKNFFSALLSGDFSKFIDKSSGLYKLLSLIAGWLMDKLISGVETIANIDWSAIIQGIQSGLGSILGIIDKIATKILQVFHLVDDTAGASAIGNIGDSFDKVNDRIIAFKNNANLGYFFTSLKNTGMGMSAVFDNIATSVAEMAGKLEPAKVLVFGFGATLTGFILTLTNTMKAAKSAFAGLGGIFTQIKMNIAAVKPSRFEKIATAITILAGAMVILAAIDQDRLKQATTSMVVIATALGALTLLAGALAIAVEKLGVAPFTLEFVSRSMTQMAVSIGVLAIAFKMLSTIDVTNIGAQLVTFSIALAAFVASAIVLNKYAKNLTVDALGLIALGIGIAAITKALQNIQDVNFNGINISLKTLIVSMGYLYILSVATRKTTFGSALGVIGLLASIVVVIGMLKFIQRVNYGELINGLKSAILMMVTMGMLCKAVGNAGENAAKAGVALIGLGAAILLITSAVKELQKVPLSAVIKGTAAVSAMIFMLRIFVEGLDNISDKAGKVGAVLLLTSAAILLLSTAVEYLGGLDMKQLIKGTVAVSAMIAMFSMFVIAASTAKKASASLVALTLAIGMITASIALLTLLNMKEVLAASVSLGIVIVSIGKTMGVVSKIQWKSALKSTAMLMVLIGSIDWLVHIMNRLDSHKSLANALAIRMVMSAMAATVKIVNGIKVEDLSEAAKVVAEAALYMGAATALLTLLDNILYEKDIVTLTESAALVSGLMIVIAGSIAILNRFGGAVKGADMRSMLGEMAAFIGGAMLVMVVLAELYTQYGDLSGMTASVLQLSAIMLALVGVVSIAGMIKDADPRSISAIMLGVLEFIGILAACVTAAGLLMLIPGFGIMIQNGVELFSVLGQAFGALIGGFVGGIGIGFSFAFIVIAKNLSKGMTELKPFVEGASMIDWSLLRGITALSAALLEITAAEIITGIASILSFGDKISKFSKHIKMITEPLVEFMQTVGAADFSQSKVYAANAAMHALAEFIRAVPAEGGIHGAVMGTKDLGKFGDQLHKFAPSFVAYANLVKGVDFSGAVESSNAAAKTIAAFAKSIPAQGGWASAIFGEHDLGVFGEQLRLFGAGFKAYAWFVADINTDGVINASTAAATTIAKFAQSIPSTNNSVIGWLFGEQDIGVFGEQLKTFGSAFRDYSGYVQNIPDNIVSKTENICGAIDLLTEATADVKNMGAFYEVFHGDGGVDTFAQNITSMSKALKPLLDEIAKLPDTVDQMNLKQRFIEIGKEIGEGLADGIFENYDRTSAEIRILVANVLATMKSEFRMTPNSQEAYEIGKYVISGLVTGLSDSAYLANIAAANIARDIIDIFRQVLQIHSPSRLARNEVGVWIVRGIADGIESDMSAEDAAAKKASNIVTAFQNELQKHSLDMTTADLEFNLWKEMNPKATEDEMRKQQETNLTTKLRAQAKRVLAADAQYQATLKAIGESAEGTQEAYNSYLQEKISMAQLAKEMSELRGGNDNASMSATDSMVAYAQYIAESKEQLLDLGFTMDEIEAAARERTGYTGKIEESSGLKEVNDIIDEFMTDTNNQVEIHLDKIAKTASSKAAGGAGGAVSAVNAVTSEGIDQMMKDVGEKLTGSGGIGGTITSGLSEIFNKDSASGAVEGFINGIGEKYDAVKDAGINFFKGLIRGLKDPASVVEVHDAGESAGQVALNGYDEATDTNSPSKEMEKRGVFFDEGLANGIDSNEGKDAVKRATAAMVDSIVVIFDARALEWKNIGKNICRGIATGITDNRFLVDNAIKKVAEGTVKVAQVTLDINSPSRRFMEVGRYCDMGLAQGLTDYAHLVTDSTEGIGNETINSMENVISRVANFVNDGIDGDIVITPVLNLDEIQNGIDFMNAVMPSGKSIQLEGTVRRANLALNSLSNRADISGVSNLQGTTNNYFTQNNYSPKALSRLDIYRQTRNQFSAAKGRVTAR